MKHLKRLKIGSLELDSNVFYSPLAGCSDFPFRQMSALYHPGLMFCEMVKMEALIRHDPGTYRILDYNAAMRPIGAQLCGSNPKIAGAAARIIEDLGFDLIDLNCGCPVDKVTKDGSGSGMLKTPERIGEVLSAIIGAVSIPVTVKIRAGWDFENIIAGRVTEIAEQAGAQAIAVHGRTRSQGYKGPANWDFIKQAVQARRSILVIGNGDVLDGPSAQALFEHTGCDAVLASRGILGSPWLAEQIRSHLNGVSASSIQGEQIRDAMIQHLAFTRAYEAPRRAVIAMRRVGCWYLRGGKGTKQLRETLNRATSLREVETLIETYDWDGVNGEELPILC